MPNFAKLARDLRTFGKLGQDCIMVDNLPEASSSKDDDDLPVAKSTKENVLSY